ncbi:MAG: dicarboxylate/amino acid:cation symporter [Bacteroidia bacterium]|nr:dicarboxylate/amino acid:cation symporter [Bacteroidia bacterium]MDW8235143.1 dicarboxylate/amino acid:cation symporter [Bacteroidia bacterium]
MAKAKDWQLSGWLLIGFLVGAGLGMLVRSLGLDQGPLLFIAKMCGEVFLRGILMLILPLIVPMLLLGVQKLTQTGAMGKIGIATLFTVLGLTGIAAKIGLLLANLIQPGQMLSPEARQSLIQRFGTASPAGKSLSSELFLNLIPKNPFYDIATAFTPQQQGGLLAVVSFTLLLGLALARLPSEQTNSFYQALNILYQASQWLLMQIMRWIAPIGVAGLIFQAVVGLGGELFLLLGLYALTVIIGLLLHGGGIYTLFLRYFSRCSPWQVLRQSSPALLIAFSSASSNATLPTTLKVAIERLHLYPPVAQFILTLGATVNQNGTALYEGVTLLFLMQVFGVPLSWGEQILIVGLAMLIAIGAAGVPGGSLPLLAGVLPQFGVPAAAIALIYGIDRFLDMMRTTLNVYGDLVIATYLNRLYYGSPADPTTTQNMAQ